MAAQNVVVVILIICSVICLTLFICVNTQIWEDRKHHDRSVINLHSIGADVVASSFRRADTIEYIKQHNTNCPAYEVGYLMQTIFERYRRMVDKYNTTKARRAWLFEAEHVLYLEEIETNYWEVVHLTNMLHEVERKYNVSSPLGEILVEVRPWLRPGDKWIDRPSRVVGKKKPPRVSIQKYMKNKFRPNYGGDKQRPKDQGDKQRPKDQGDKQRPKDQGDKHGSKDEGDKQSPKDDGDKQSPKDEGDKKDPKDEGDKHGSKDEGDKHGSKDEGDQQRPKDEGDQQRPKDEGDKQRPKDEGDKQRPKDEGDKQRPKDEGDTQRPKDERDDREYRPPSVSKIPRWWWPIEYGWEIDYYW